MPSAVASVRAINEYYLENKGQNPKIKRIKIKKTRYKWSSKFKNLELDIVRNLVLYLPVNVIHPLNKKKSTINY